MTELSLIFVVAGFFLLLVGGEVLLRGAIALGKHLNLSPIVIGIVIIGFGTSMPELAISIDAVLSGVAPIAIGNAVGSNISNILFILPFAALIRPIARSERLLIPDGMILILVSAGFVGLCYMGLIEPWHGGIMITLLVLIMSVEYFRMTKHNNINLLKQAPITIKQEKIINPLLALLLAIIGIAGLIVGAEFLIKGGVEIARALKVPEEVIGLSIIAIGTSLPELASVIVASIRGHSEVAYGNIFGSNLFNLLGIIGVTSLVSPIQVPTSIFYIDGPVMIAATIVMLFFLWTGKGLSRLEGLLMFLAYIGYITARYVFI